MVGLIGSNGGTRHIYYLEPEKAVYSLKINFIAQPFGIIAVATGKIAVAALYLRILPSISWKIRFFLHGLITITGVLAIITIILTFRQCENIAALWDPSLQPTTYCWDPAVQINFSIFTASWNAFIDFILALMPIPLVWQLKTTVRRRVGLVMLLGCGLLSGVFASIKTSQLAALFARGDLTWDSFDLFLWVSGEIFVLILCGSIPTSKPLWERFCGHKRQPTKNYSRVVIHREFGSMSINKSFKGRYHGHELMTSLDEPLGNATLVGRNAAPN